MDIIQDYNTNDFRDVLARNPKFKTGIIRIKQKLGHFKNKKLHRIGGPALIDYWGSKRYYYFLEGNMFHPDQYKERLREFKLKSFLEGEEDNG